MLTTVNKQIVLTASAFCIGMIAILSSHKTMNSGNAHQSEVVPIISNVQANDKFKETNAPIPPVSIPKQLLSMLVKLMSRSLA